MEHGPPIHRTQVQARGRQPSRSETPYAARTTVDKSRLHSLTWAAECGLLGRPGSHALTLVVLKLPSDLRPQIAEHSPFDSRMNGESKPDGSYRLT